MGASMKARSDAIKDATALAAGAAEPAPRAAARDAAQTAATPPPAAGRDKARARTRGAWQAWRARFGLAEACGSIGALAGFAAGYLPGGSLITAAGLATICEVVGFYGCIGVKTALAARRATVHLAGWRRLSAGAWHAVREQLASCLAAEALDDFLIRPGCMAGAAWLLRPLPGGVWIGFAAGKAAADLAWYGMEALARRGMVRTVTARPPPTFNGCPAPEVRIGARAA
jgi:hypothetical protein